MAIISFDKDAVINFIPRYGDNRKSGDPCVVRTRYISFARSQHYTTLMAGKYKDAKGDPEKIAESDMQLQKKQFV
jgi:hypothetical protein